MKKQENLIHSFLTPLPTLDSSLFSVDGKTFLMNETSTRLENDEKIKIEMEIFPKLYLMKKFFIFHCRVSSFDAKSWKLFCVFSTGTSSNKIQFRFCFEKHEIKSRNCFEGLKKFLFNFAWLVVIHIKIEYIDFKAKKLTR